MLFFLYDFKLKISFLLHPSIVSAVMVVFKLIAAVSLVLAALSAAGVSAQTHHVLAGQHVWGPALDVNSWLSGRVFRVGDKICKHPPSSSTRFCISIKEWWFF